MDCFQLAIYVPPIHQEMLMASRQFDFEDLEHEFSLIEIAQSLEVE